MARTSGRRAENRGKPWEFLRRRWRAREYLHGPNLQLTPNYTVFVLDPGDETTDRIQSIAEATRQVTPRMVWVTMKADDGEPTTFALNRSLDEAPTPFAFLPLFQRIAWRAAEDLHRWQKHPLFSRFREKIAYKTESYNRQKSTE